MAKIRFQCACGKSLAVDDQFAGRIAKCPACHRSVQIPAPDDAKPQPDAKNAGTAEQIASLADAYGTAVLTKARRERVKVVLDQYAHKVRRRNLIIAAAVLAALVLVFVGWRVFQSHGISLDESQCPRGTAEFRFGLRSGDIARRTAATWEFADIGGADASWIVGRMAQEPDERLQLVAVRTLEQTDRTQGPTYLKPLLHSPRRNVRMAAAFALVRCAAEPLALNNLAPHLAVAFEDDPDARGWLDRAAAEKTPSRTTLNWLVGRRTSRAAADRAAGAWLTAALLGPDPELLALLRDPDSSVVIAAVCALAPFLTPDEFARLEKLDGGEEERRGRLVALNGVGRLLRSPDRDVRAAAALVLAFSPQRSQIGLFDLALKDSDWLIRFAALKGLSHLNPSDALKVIRESGIAAAAENEWNRRVILRIEQKAGEAEKKAADK